jgi:hypothetical protein
MAAIASRQYPSASSVPRGGRKPPALDGIDQQAGELVNIFLRFFGIEGSDHILI